MEAHAVDWLGPVKYEDDRLTRCCGTRLRVHRLRDPSLRGGGPWKWSRDGEGIVLRHAVFDGLGTSPRRARSSRAGPQAQGSPWLGGAGGSAGLVIDVGDVVKETVAAGSSKEPVASTTSWTMIPRWSPSGCRCWRGAGS